MVVATSTRIMAEPHNQMKANLNALRLLSRYHHAEPTLQLPRDGFGFAQPPFTSQTCHDTACMQCGT